MKPWEETIREAVAVDGLHSDKYSEKRSALRKAFAICLEGSHENWTDPEWVQNKWETGTWRDHVTLTRPSAAGLAACFGAPANLIAQMVALHFTTALPASTRRIRSVPWQVSGSRVCLTTALAQTLHVAMASRLVYRRIGTRVPTTSKKRRFSTTQGLCP